MSDRLRLAAAKWGGFHYRFEETGQIVFAPTDKLERIWWHQDHLAEMDRNKPFGFLYHATRPNFEMRSPTEDDERKLAAIRRHAARSNS